MPTGFDQCRQEGGRIRTIKPREDVYLHICWDKMGKSHAGEIKHNKTPYKNNSKKVRFLSPKRKRYNKPLYQEKLDSDGINRNKLYIGPKGGKYVLVNGRKVYVRT